MRDLKCHYCGAECRISGRGRHYVSCLACRADGPMCDDPEAAAAAHATVMPVLRWSSEPPKVGAATWHRCEHSEYAARLVRYYDPTDICPLNHLQSPCPTCEFAPIPTPADAAEGGGL